MFIAGGTFAGFKGSDIKPTEIDLVKNYNEDPTLDVALMIDGLNVLFWAEDYKKKPRLSNLAAKIKGSVIVNQDKKEEEKK